METNCCSCHPIPHLLDHLLQLQSDTRSHRSGGEQEAKLHLFTLAGEIRVPLLPSSHTVSIRRAHLGPASCHSLSHPLPITGPVHHVFDIAREEERSGFRLPVVRRMGEFSSSDSTVYISHSSTVVRRQRCIRQRWTLSQIRSQRSWIPSFRHSFRIPFLPRDIRSIAPQVRRVPVLACGVACYYSGE